MQIPATLAPPTGPPLFALANAKKLLLRCPPATRQSTLLTPVFSFKDNYDPRQHGFVSAATYGDIKETDAEANALAQRHFVAVALITPVALSCESGRLRRSASPHWLNTWSAGGESWAWAPQTVPSGASPCRMGTQCAKPQFPPNAP